MDDRETRHEPLAELPRKFGFWTGLFVMVSSMVGSGILVTSGYQLRTTENHLVLLGLWGLGGVLALAGSLTMAEMATAFPRAGGDYVFVRIAFGPACGFVYGWSTLLIGFAAPIAVVSQTAAEYLLAPWLAAGAQTAAKTASLATPIAWSVAAPGLYLLFVGPAGALAEVTATLWFPPPGWQGAYLLLGLASLIIIIFTWSHCRGHENSAAVQVATSALKTGMLAALALVGLLWGQGNWHHLTVGKPLADQAPAALATGLIYIMYCYTGWNGAVYLAGEIRDPPRLLPRCLLIGCFLVTGLYLLINLTYAYAIAPDELRGQPDSVVQPVAHYAATRLFHRRAGDLLSLVVGLGVLASVSAFILSGPRVTFAMARNHLFPRFAGALHAGTGMPVAATVVQGVLALTFLWSGAAATFVDYLRTGALAPDHEERALHVLQSLLNYAGTGLAIISAMVVLPIFVLRRQQRFQPTFRTPFYPLPPLLFLAISAWMIIANAWEPDQRLPSLVSVLTILAGFPLYWLLRRVGAIPPQDVSV